jgi:NADPH-dependent 2,4-dienoyl-CoA reductase/sulfur reductase-like enzyme
VLHRIVVVGASLAGLRAAETLRDRGFDGDLTLIGDEPHRPYDRPPLSKQVLQGLWEPDQTFFRRKDGYDALALDVRLGVRATSVDLRARRVTLADGSVADYDRLIIARSFSVFAAKFNVEARNLSAVAESLTVNSPVSGSWITTL